MIAALLKMRSSAGPDKGQVLYKYPGSQQADCL